MKYKYVMEILFLTGNQLIMLYNTLVTHKFSKGEEKTIKVPDTEYETVIKYYFSGGNIFRFTVYKPSEIALDELYSTSNGMFFLQLIDL